MKDYLILVSFKGSQTGNDGPYHFEKGTTCQLSDSLAEVALKEKWVKAVSYSVEDALASVAGVDVPQGDLEADLAAPAELRETKVEFPGETKEPEKPAKGKKKGKA